MNNGVLWFALMSVILVVMIFAFMKPRDRKKFWKLFKSSFSLGNQKPKKGLKSHQRGIKKERNQTSNFVLPQGFQLWGKEVVIADMPLFRSKRAYIKRLDVILQDKAEPLIVHYTKKIGHESVPLIFKRAKSKWGHCKHYRHERYEIMLNRALVFLPEKYLEGVVVHEVAHLQHPHHQKSFRELVLKLQPNNKILNKELNKCYGRLARQSDIFGMRK